MTQQHLYAYLQRIKLTTSLKPNTLETLRLLQQHHVASIAFESLHPLLKLPVHIDTASLMDKLVHNQQGGYCFEQNLLFKEVLQHYGFSVRAVMGRVKIPGKIHFGRTHLLLLVELAGETYLSDVGFGGLGSNQPLLLMCDLEQQTSLESYKVTSENHTDFNLNVFVKNRWKKLYSFDLKTYTMGDFEVSNWYTSTSPESSFTNHLMCARIESDKRFTLFNNKFNIHHKNSDTPESITLKSVQEIREVLANSFHLNINKLEQLNDTLKKIVG